MTEQKTTFIIGDTVELAFGTPYVQIGYIGKIIDIIGIGRNKEITYRVDVPQGFSAFWESQLKPVKITRSTKEI